MGRIVAAYPVMLCIVLSEAMAASSINDQGRLVHRFGGVPVGSFAQPRVRPLIPTVAHALFYDQTHDNPSPVEVIVSCCSSIILGSCDFPVSMFFL